MSGRRCTSTRHGDDGPGARLALLAAVAAVFAFPLPVAADVPRPNVVFILADDLGYGDLGAYGATDIATTHIDRLAREGVRFTDFYAVGNTCSPSRAALMTGRYPPRSGVNAVLFHDTPEGLPASELTIPELLRDAGYRTAMVGKWHLGVTDEFMPMNHGFTEFFGVPHSNDEKNFFVYDGRRRIPEAVDQSRLTRRYTDRALEFLDRAAQGDAPFFLYVAYNAPHVPLYPSAAFAGRSHRGTYGDVVEEMDASVGEILAKLAALGLDRNTLVIFTSDNGPWLAMRDWGGSAGGLRGGKTSTFEGGHRVPAIARWPERIAAGTVIRGVADMMDWLPTLVELGGARLPHDRAIDGRSLTGALQGRGEREARPFFYLRIRFPLADQHHQVGAVRDGRWKLKLAQRGYPRLLEPLMRSELYRHGLLLFDLEADPGEQHDVAAEHPEVVARLANAIEAFDASLSPAPPVLIGAAPYDHLGWEKLWRGVAAGFAVMLGALALLLVAGVWALRWVRRRWRSSGARNAPPSARERAAG
jgi:arylsulfatase A-like enzyme